MKLNEAVVILANKIEFGNHMVYTDEEVNTAILTAREFAKNSYNESSIWEEKNPILQHYDSLVSEWHSGKGEHLSLIEYLGLTSEQYELYVTRPEHFVNIISSYSSEPPFIDNDHILHFSNGEEYELSWWDRFKLYFDFISFENFERKKRKQVTLG